MTKIKKKLKIKNFLILIIIIISLFFIYKNYKFNKMNSIILNTKEETIKITDYKIYGTHLNISGKLKKIKYDKIYLVLKNELNEQKIKIKVTKKDNYLTFTTSNKINKGIFLEKITNGKYYLLIKAITNDKATYYTTINNTNYKNIDYYSISKKHITSSNTKIKNKTCITYNITNKTNNKVYDIVIDPGHGGIDTGSSNTYNKKRYFEADITLNISKKIKNELEKMGYKVYLTRNDDTYLYPFKNNGRALIPNNVKAKYSFSIHLNSTEYNMKKGGVEVYIPKFADYNLAKSLAKNIKDYANTTYSNTNAYKVANGVYVKTLTEEEIKSENKYKISKDATYYFMVREVGGLSTLAYVNKYNKYYDSNQTAEGYLIELGYLTYYKDLENLVNNQDGYAKGVANGIKNYLNNAN